jgi:hypothetical protein
MSVQLDIDLQETANLPEIFPLARKLCRASFCHAALLRNQHALRDKLISQQSTNCEGYEEP